MILKSNKYHFGGFIMRALIAITALIIILPKIGLQCLMALYHQKRISLWVCKYAGVNLSIIKHRTILISNQPLSDVDKWLHYLKGNFDLTGPQAIEFQKAIKLDDDNQVRFDIAPGIISPYQIKQTSGIAHNSEQEISLAFVKGVTYYKRIMLMIVWSIQKLIGREPNLLKTPSEFMLFGVRISNRRMQTAINKIMQSLETSKQNTKAATYAFVNADCANHYYEDEQYKSILNSFSNVFPDGIGVKIAARHQGLALKENVNGTDMFPLLCKKLNTHKKRVFLLGATPNVIKKTATKLAQQYPNIRIAGYIDGYRFNDDSKTLCDHINQTNTDLLFVAMGAPRQEKWINDNIARLNVKAAIGVGGLFDFYSEQVSRAPEWLRELSLEWVWRLIAQPMDKGKRYLIGNPLFLIHVYMSSKQSHYQTTS